MAKLIVLASNAHSLINFRFHLINHWRQSGIEVEALAPQDASFVETTEKLKKIGVPLQPVAVQNTRLNLFHDLKLLNQLKKIFLKKKPKIAFFYTIKPVIYGCIAARWAKVPQIYAMISGLGYVFNDDKNNYKRRLLAFIVKKMYGYALKKTTHVFFHNRDDANLFLRLRLVTPQQIIVTDGSGVDLHYFSPMAYPEVLSFLFVGRLIRDKGIYEFIAAAKEIKRKYSHVRFLVAGGLHENPTALTEAQIEELRQSEVLEYLGEVKDIRDALQQASVFVLPSYREGLSRAALEALATARPVITTDAPGCREVANPSVNGFRVPIRAVTELIHSLTYFIENTAMIPIMGAASRALAVERFCVDKINTQILKAMGLL